MSGRWDLSDGVRRVLAFRDARDWRQFHRPKELAAALAIEAAELQELFLWREPETAEQVAADATRAEHLRDELADVAIFLLMLAHDLGIDLADAVAGKVAKNDRRYPVERHRGVAAKAPRGE